MVDDDTTHIIHGAAEIPLTIEVSEEDENVLGYEQAMETMSDRVDEEYDIDPEAYFLNLEEVEKLG